MAINQLFRWKSLICPCLFYTAVLSLLLWLKGKIVFLSHTCTQILQLSHVRGASRAHRCAVTTTHGRGLCRLVALLGWYFDACRVIIAHSRRHPTANVKLFSLLSAWSWAVNSCCCHVASRRPTWQHGKLPCGQGGPTFCLLVHYPGAISSTSGLCWLHVIYENRSSRREERNGAVHFSFWGCLWKSYICGSHFFELIRPDFLNSFFFTWNSKLSMPLVN